MNPEVGSRLLENRRFTQLTNMIALYFDATTTSGFAAQNQILQSLSSMLLITGKEQPDIRKASQQAAKAVSEQIPISSVTIQNPPILLPPKSVSRKQRYINTLDFPTKNRVSTEMLLAPIGNPEPRRYSPLDIL